MPPTELATYFIAERQGGFCLVALALVSLGFAGVLWAQLRPLDSRLPGRARQTPRAMKRAHVLVALLFLAASAADLHSAEPPSDAPEYPRDPTVIFTAAVSYEHALDVWKTPEDINAWIAANFSYDMARAMRLSETQRVRSEPLSIHAPSDFFDTKAGVCVDLSRFAVETLRRIDPQSDPKYLMIEFAPMRVGGNVLRLHWLVRFTRDGRVYFFSDSKRPGHIAGPYADTREFIDDYARYRGRPIVAFRELDSYQKQRRTRAVKTRE